MRFTSYLAAAVLAASSAPSWAELSERWVRVAAGGDATYIVTPSPPQD